MAAGQAKARTKGGTRPDRSAPPASSRGRVWLAGAVTLMLLVGLLVGAVVVSGGEDGTGAAPAGASTDATLIGPEQAQELVAQRSGDADFTVLDVRTPEEFAAGHIEGATLIDLSATDFTSRVGELDRSRTYLVYCRSGNRSAAAVQEMQRLGFTDLYDMRDGFIGWQSAGGPSVRS
jgi:phage shock protein E